MPTRFYPTTRIPAAIIHGPCRGAWGLGGVYGAAWTPVNWQFEMSTSKVNGGPLSTRFLAFNQPNYDGFWLSLWTPPLQGQTVSGALNFCFHGASFWYVNGDAPGWPWESVISDSAQVYVRIHSYISVGDTTEVRHTLISNYVTPNRLSYLAYVGFSPTSPIPIVSGVAQEGDRVRIEIGFHIDQPYPVPNQPPDVGTRIDVRFPGVSDAANPDITPGMGEDMLNTNPWLEFSGSVLMLPPPPPPSEGTTCETAILIPSVEYYHGPGIISTQAPGPDREMWWTWIAPRAGDVIFHNFGSNYFTRIQPKISCGPGEMSRRYYSGMAFHRSLTCVRITVEAGQQIWFRVYNNTTSFNAPQCGGVVRAGLFYVATAPQQDDIYLPSGHVTQFRDGQIVNLIGDFNSYAPSGVAIDYTRLRLYDGDEYHDGERLLVALFSIEIVEQLDLPTMSWSGGELGYIDAQVPRTATLYITRSGQLYMASFGQGFIFVMGEGGNSPAELYTTSNNPALDDIGTTPANSSEWSGDGPVISYLSPAAAKTSPWAITIDEDNGILYYTEGSLYLPLPGGSQAIRRFNLNTNTQMPDFAVLPVPAAAVNLPGVKGLTFIPYDGSLLVCNATEVVHLDSSGAVIGTYTPSVPMDSQSLMDVKVQADGQTFWVVDLQTIRMFKVDLPTMTEIATYETWLVPGAMTQIAIYQPEGIIIIPPPEVDDCLIIANMEPTPVLPPWSTPGTAPVAPGIIIEEGYAGMLGVSAFGELMLAHTGLTVIDDSGSGDCLPIVEEED